MNKYTPTQLFGFLIFGLFIFPSLLIIAASILWPAPVYLSSIYANTYLYNQSITFLISLFSVVALTLLLTFYYYAHLLKQLPAPEDLWSATRMSPER